MESGQLRESHWLQKIYIFVSLIPHTVYQNSRLEENQCVVRKYERT